ncbi:hypothetical protein K0C01_02390 [Salinarchaeum sp. IM2453]|uniref:hypothetical protein n=1 Tax=Salinarchaeum sp. IM2453 TaxID=2862870 RepID=UPI001C830346|nr:hypothetical protein [Salinarchaeum sp. IM2453]QZA89033.1 hypothetical protein K0C01_02390 [Salinarchaeum sp. IM2453]
MAQRSQSATDRTSTAVPENTSGYRIPTASVIISGLLAGSSLLWIGVVLDAGWLIGAGFGCGVILAVTAANTTDDGGLRADVFGIGFLLTIGGTVAIPAYAVTTATAAVALAVGGSIITGFGIAQLRALLIGNGALIDALGWLTRVAVVLGLCTGLVALIQLEVSAVLGPLSALIAPTTATAEAVSFLVLAWLCVGGIWGIGAVLPPATVFGSDTKARYQRLTTSIQYGVGIIIGGGSLLVVLIYLISVETTVAAETIEQTIGPLVTGTAIRGALMQGLLLLGLVIVSIRVFRTAGIALLYERPAWIPVAAVLTGGAVLIAWQFGDQIQTTVTQTHELVATPVTAGTTLTGELTVGLGLITLGIFGVIAVFLGVVIATRTGLLPATTGPARLAVVGLVLGAIGATLGDTGTGTVLFGIMSAVVVWDITEFGIGQTIAVGSMPAHRDGALVAAGISILVGVGSLLFTGGLYTLLTRVTVEIQYGILPLGVALLAAVLAIVFVYWNQRD